MARWGAGDLAAKRLPDLACMLFPCGRIASRHIGNHAADYRFSPRCQDVGVSIERGRQCTDVGDDALRSHAANDVADLPGDLGELPLVVPFGFASGKEPFASETACLAQAEKRLSKRRWCRCVNDHGGNSPRDRREFAPSRLRGSIRR